METPKHTPGPWAIAYRHASDPKADYYNLCDSTGNLVCTLHRYGDKPFYDIAQLIAQAPALLEALEALTNAITGDVVLQFPHLVDVSLAACKVIGKAKGVQSQC